MRLIKNLIKTYLPSPVVRKIEKIVSSFYRMNFDRLSLFERDLDQNCIFKRNLFPHKEFGLKFDDAMIVNSLSRYNHYEQKEYIYRFEGDVYIEPSHGFVIKKGKVLKPSIPYYYDAAFPVNSLLKLATRKKINIISEKTIISLRDVYEGNYFHFFNDVYAKLALLLRGGNK